MAVTEKELRDQDDHVAIAKPRVLVVDDSRVMRKSIIRLLSDDFDVVEASDGDIGWETLIEDDGIQVIFADLMMPNTDGFALLRQIRNSEDSRINQLPVIIITSHEDDEEMKHQAMSLGATDFISKPFDSVQLIARAHAHAKHDHTARQLRSANASLAEKSTIDTLTGLPNPLYFREHGPELLAFAARQGTNLAVLRIDIDHFDTLFKKKGKQVAEKVLLKVSKLITACVREEDSVARVGLAQFAVIMPGADEERASSVARRIHQLVFATIYKLGTTRFRMTASVGAVTRAEDERVDFIAVVQTAEQRLNHAIEKGGNRVELSKQQHGALRLVDQTAAPERKKLSVDEALVLLRAGQTDKISEELPALIARVAPLLSYGNKELRLGLEGSLMQLRDKLEALNKG